MRGIDRYIEDLLRGRRPRPFRATAGEAGLARTAITLRSARPGSAAPAPEFVTGLHKRLAAELTQTPPRPAGQARRRAFMQATLAAGGAAAVGAGLDHLLASPGGATPGREPAAIVPDHGSWHDVLPSASLPEGAVSAFTLDTVTGFIQRTAGRLRAVSGICTHQGCRLELARSRAELDCPCHGAVFALDGTVLRHRLSISLAALPEIAVRESGGTIQVYAPAAPPGGTATPGQVRP